MLYGFVVLIISDEAYIIVLVFLTVAIVLVIVHIISIRIRLCRFLFLLLFLEFPGRGRNAEITDEEKAWIINIACQKPIDFGYAAEAAGYTRLSTISPLYNFINDRLVDESTDLKPFHSSCFYVCFDIFYGKWQKISGCESPDLSKADIRNPLRYLLMNAVASRSVSGSFQLPLT